MLIQSRVRAISLHCELHQRSIENRHRRSDRAATAVASKPAFAHPGRRDAQVTENPGCDGDTWKARLRLNSWHLRSVFSRDPCRLVHNEYGYVCFAAFDFQSQLIFQGPLP